MKTTHAIVALFALSTLAVSSVSAAPTAPTAPAAAGAFDGDYVLRYGAMDMTLQCGYVVDGAIQGESVTLSLDVAEDEQLAAGSFDALIDARYAAIEAKDLNARQEKAAKTATDAFFLGLERSIETLIQTFPDLLRIDAIDQAAPASPVYAFEGVMVDEDLAKSVTAPGSMNRTSGEFELIPVYVYKKANVQGIESMSAFFQLSGDAAQSQGDMDWRLEARAKEPATGALWGCVSAGAVDLAMTLQ